MRKITRHEINYHQPPTVPLCIASIRVVKLYKFFNRQYTHHIYCMYKRENVSQNSSQVNCGVKFTALVQISIRSPITLHIVGKIFRIYEARGKSTRYILILMLQSTYNYYDRSHTNIMTRALRCVSSSAYEKKKQKKTSLEVLSLRVPILYIRLVYTYIMYPIPHTNSHTRSNSPLDIFFCKSCRVFAKYTYNRINTRSYHILA